MHINTRVHMFYYAHKYTGTDVLFIIEGRKLYDNE